MECPELDSNQRPSAPEADALSPELSGRGRFDVTSVRGLSANSAPLVVYNIPERFC